jgi:hypothetical protein
MLEIILCNSKNSLGEAANSEPQLPALVRTYEILLSVHGKFHLVMTYLCRKLKPWQKIITATVYFATSDTVTWNLHALILKRIRQISCDDNIFMYLGGVKPTAEYYNLLETMDAVAPQVCPMLLCYNYPLFSNSRFRNHTRTVKRWIALKQLSWFSLFPAP